MSTKKRGGPPPACLPAEYEKADIAAVQACAAGVGSADQQKRALEWIVHKAANTYDLHYRPGEEGRRDTDFALGRAFVGAQITKMLKLRPQ